MIRVEISIKNYLEASIPELRNKMYPVFTTDISVLCVVYRFLALAGGHIKQSQLELKIVHEDYDACKEMEEKIIRLLDMESDMSFRNTGNIRFHSELAGGGILFNDGCQMWEDTIYFIIDWRKLNGK